MSISPELRARFAEAAKRAADEGERTAPVTPGSDVAFALKRLFSDFPERLAERATPERRRAAA